MDVGKEASVTSKVSVVQILGAAVTLAATLLGGGGAVVPIEDTVRFSGFILSPFLLVIGGAWTVYTSWVLLRVSVLTGEASYEDIAERTLGCVGSWLVQGEILINAFLICVSVQGLFSDFLLVVSPFDDVPRSVMVIIGGVVVLPLTALVRRVDRLAPMSLITAITALIFLGFAMAKAAATDLPADGYYPGPSGSKAGTVWLDALSTITIAFVVQFNVLPVYQSLPAASAYSAMMTALFLGTSLVFVVYVLIEVFSYIAHGSLTYDAILLSYANMPGGGFATVQLGIGQLISYPIIAHAAVTQISGWMGPASTAVRRWQGDTPHQKG